MSSEEELEDAVYFDDGFEVVGTIVLGQGYEPISSDGMHRVINEEWVERRKFSVLPAHMLR